MGLFKCAKKVDDQPTIVADRDPELAVRLLSQVERGINRDRSSGPRLTVHAAPGQLPWTPPTTLAMWPMSSRRSPPLHLGDLALIWLYRNDQQIKEIGTVRFLPTRPAMSSLFGKSDSPSSLTLLFI